MTLFGVIPPAPILGAATVSAGAALLMPRIAARIWVHILAVACWGLLWLACVEAGRRALSADILPLSPGLGSGITMAGLGVGWFAGLLCLVLAARVVPPAPTLLEAVLAWAWGSALLMPQLGQGGTWPPTSIFAAAAVTGLAPALGLAAAPAARDAPRIAGRR
jgi:hypothetical protein